MYAHPVGTKRALTAHGPSTFFWKVAKHGAEPAGSSIRKPNFTFGRVAGISVRFCNHRLGLDRDVVVDADGVIVAEGDLTTLAGDGTSSNSASKYPTFLIRDRVDNRLRSDGSQRPSWNTR